MKLSQTRPLLYVLAGVLLVVSNAEANFLRVNGNGGLVEALEMSVISEISRQLNEAAATNSDTDAANSEGATTDNSTVASPDEDEPEEEEEEAAAAASYDPNSDASLLNQLIEFFLPHINTVFQKMVPDPLGVPYDGNLSMPTMNLMGGACSADAGMKFSFGTLNGASLLAIDRIRIIAGTERVDAGWNPFEGCFKTLFSAFFDIDISSDTELTIDDFGASISARACSYAIHEEISGGIRTFQPRLYGRVNISGMLFGTKATLGNVEFVDHALDIGYSSIEAYVNDVPPAVNEAVANITRELSQAAQEQVVEHVLNDEAFMRAFQPQVNEHARESIQQQEIELNYTEAFAIGGLLVVNNVIRQTSNFWSKLGFSITPVPAPP